MVNRKPYPTDVSDEEWAFVAPYLILFPLDAGQRRHDLREVFNALRYVVCTGCLWRMLVERAQRLPGTRLVYVADREADMLELMQPTRWPIRRTMCCAPILALGAVVAGSRAAGWGSIAASDCPERRPMDGAYSHRSGAAAYASRWATSATSRSTFN